METRRLIRIALFSAAALIMSIIENSIPPLLAFAPGVKMGLANVVSLIALIILGVSDAFVILLVRCLLGASIGGSIQALMYSVPAGVTALLVQALMYRFLFPKVSLLCVSLTGAAVHNLVQLAVASLIVRVSLAAVLPLTLAASIIAGLFVGACTYFCVKYLPKTVYMDKALGK